MSWAAFILCIPLTMIGYWLGDLAESAKRFVDACDRNEREARGE